MFYGVSEEEGVPVEIDGLDVPDADHLVQQVDQIIRDGLEPKLAGHRVHPIRLQSGKYVILVRIPRSYAGPHRVRFQSAPQFWARRSNGKYFLEMNELRNEFLLSETAAERIRQFRADRVGTLLAGTGPVVLLRGPKIILHLVPIDAFLVRKSLNLHVLENAARKHASALHGGDGPSPNHERYNLDGYLIAHLQDGDLRRGLGCCQWFRNGIVESCDSLYWTEDKRLSDGPFDYQLPESVRRLLEGQKQIGVQPPVIAMLTVSGVKDCRMAVAGSYAEKSNRLHPIDRDLLLVPEVMVDSFEADVAASLKPLIDAVWSAAGYRESPVRTDG